MRSEVVDDVDEDDDDDNDDDNGAVVDVLVLVGVEDGVLPLLGDAGHVADAVDAMLCVLLVLRLDGDVW